MLRIPSPGEPKMLSSTPTEMPPTVQHTWQLECWGHGWAWAGCEGASDGWGNVSLVPLKQRAVEVTWVWPEWSGGPVSARHGPPDEDLRYQVEYGPLNAPFMLGRVGGSSRGVTLEEGVEPFTTYEVKLTTDAMANTSAIFFQIIETVTETGARAGKVRAEEVLLVILVLALWAVAILLFFHRWGKIRMLEPYQPEYKALNHSPACPLAPTTPTQSQPRLQNAKPLLPRKSSSLCFTPSMLRTVHVPPACRISVPHIDQTPVHRCSRPAHQSPAAHSAIARHRLRLASDSLDQSSSGQPQVQVETSRKVRSAENLRHYRITTTYSRGYSEESAVRVAQGLGDGPGLHHHPLARRRSCQSQSLDLEHYRSPTPGSQEAVPRGRSLDSTSVSSLRRSPTAGPSWAAAEPACTTPELRVSPTPPDVAAHHPHALILLQRQETIIDDASLFPVPYATLLEEELENDA